MRNRFIKSGALERFKSGALERFVLALGEEVVVNLLRAARRQGLAAKISNWDSTRQSVLLISINAPS